MRSLRRAWLLPRWRPRLNWDKIKKVRDLSSEDLLANTPWCWSYRNPDFPTLEDIDLELRLARFELLITRRPLLLNSVLLRQNPHNVHEWHKRVKLYEGQPRQVGKIIPSLNRLIFVSTKLPCVIYSASYSAVSCRSSTHTQKRCKRSILWKPQENLTLSGCPSPDSMRKMNSWMTYDASCVLAALSIICWLNWWLTISLELQGSDYLWEGHKGELQTGGWSCCGVVWIWRDGAETWELWPSFAYTKGKRLHYH